MVLRASIVTIDPVVSVTAQTPAVNIDYVLMTVSVVLDASGRFRIVFDAVAVTESLSLAITKGFLDTALVTDDAPVFATARPVFDSVLAQEAFDRQVNFLRSFTDTAVVQELLAKEITRPDVTDFVSVAEQQVLATDKNLADAVMLLEGIDRFDFIKALQDQVSVFDAFTAVGKDKILDVTTTVDSITTLFTSKVAGPDAVTVADATVAALDKGLTDSVNVVEDTTFVIDYDRTAADQISLGDSPILTVGKPFVDAATAADVLNTFFVQKALAHSVSMADNLTFELILGDTIPLYDFAFIADGKFTSFPVPGTINSHLVHEPLVNGESVLTTDPNAGIVYTIRVESDSYMFSGYTLNGDQLN
jgi:hypothetical protein